MPSYSLSKDRLLRDTAAQLEVQYSRERVDALLFFLHEASLTKAERELVKENLLGQPLEEIPLSRNDADIVDDEFVDLYREYRALGLTKQEAARMLGLTPERLTYILKGDHITRSQHKAILEAEAEAEVSLKASALRVIKGVMEGGGKDAWRAALALLEKRFPAEFAKRLELQGTASLRMSAEECEDAATRAKRDLDAIRASRNEQFGIAPEDMHIRPEDYASGPDARQIELGLEQK